VTPSPPEHQFSFEVQDQTVSVVEIGVGGPSSTRIDFSVQFVDNPGFAPYGRLLVIERFRDAIMNDPTFLYCSGAWQQSGVKGATIALPMRCWSSLITFSSDPWNIMIWGRLLR
jgi:hypothetical protein